MIHQKDGDISLLGLKRHTGELFPFGKLALGQNCITIISDKSNSVAMFLRIQTDIEMKRHVKATFSLKCGSK